MSLSADAVATYGPVASSRERVDDPFRVRGTVPPGTAATVRLPDARESAVTEGGVRLAEVTGVTGVFEAGAAALVEIGSGEYTFGVFWREPPLRP